MDKFNVSLANNLEIFLVNEIRSLVIIASSRVILSLSVPCVSMNKTMFCTGFPCTYKLCSCPSITITSNNGALQPELTQKWNFFAHFALLPIVSLFVCIQSHDGSFEFLQNLKCYHGNKKVK